MPFTISHAAAVLPFSRFLARWRLLSATVIGSMVPDFSLLLPWRLSRIETHSIAGLWSFCLPVGLVTYWLFQWLIKPAVLELLPDAAYQRSRPCAAPADVADWRQWLSAAAGVLAGAVTHLAWDGFTHEGARGVRMFPVLDDSVAGINGHPMMVYRVMQLGSSAVGLLLVMVILWRALRGGAVAPLPQRPLDASQRHQWTALYALTALAASAVFLWVLLQAFDGHRFTLGSATNEVAIAALRGLALALLGVSGVLRLRLAYSRPQNPMT
jgi:multisubunit Na+/H+ antiporter MnhG subunit